MSAPEMVLFDKLELIIELLKIQVGLQASPEMLESFPDLRELQGGVAKTNKILEYLVAASLPSTPFNVLPVTVGVTEELLASNESQPLMRVDVTNLDPAQPLLVSKTGVNLASGQIILARATAPFVLPIGTELYGIVALATIQVTVSIGYDMQPVLHDLFALGS